jgi:hypothetical protein
MVYDTMADPRSFQTDLNQLADAADVQLPKLIELLGVQLTALGRYGGISLPTMTSSPDSAFYDLVGILRDRTQKGCQVLASTQEALHDIAVCYMRADGRI